MAPRDVRTSRSLIVLAALAGAACGSADPACATFTGTWALSIVPYGGVPNLCSGSRTWTLSQTGCTVTVTAPPSDEANGATGQVLGDQLHVEWSWTPTQGGCILREHVDVALVGSGMRGHYGIEECSPTTLSCGATVTASRQGL
jgi:hypothetical protein